VSVLCAFVRTKEFCVCLKRRPDNRPGGFFMEKAMCESERTKPNTSMNSDATEKERSVDADARMDNSRSVGTYGVHSYMLQERCWITEIGYK